VILSGRGINDGMAGWVAKELHKARGASRQRADAGPDLQGKHPRSAQFQGGRSGVGAGAAGAWGAVHDPHADGDEAMHEYGIPLVHDALERTYDMVVLAVPHREYLEMGGDALRGLLNGGTLADLKGELGAAADWTL
jgi:UDP-N-acetyl-D-galactosamine dehydrogenase